jgi:hypothetical protein
MPWKYIGSVACVRRSTLQWRVYDSENLVVFGFFIYEVFIMNFKKYLRTRIGQAAIEYFVLLSVIVLASAISAGVFWPKIRDSLQGKFFNKATHRIETADLGSVRIEFGE